MNDRCANCDRAIDGADQKFCPACGQPTPAHRIDWHFLGHELEHSVLHMDRGIFYSLKNLMLRPGHFIRDYIEGRRAHQVKPLMLIMILAALTGFLAKYFLDGDVVGSGISIGGTSVAGMKTDGQFDPTRFLKAFEVAKNWMNQNYAAATLLLLPLEALAFKWAFRRVANLNYPEWLVIATFLTAQSFVIMALATPLEHWYPQARGWALSLAVVYTVVSLVQYFKTYARWKSVLRCLLGFGILLVFNAVFTVVMTAVILALPMGH
ncbi:MAG: DUF3667 domain-containing protein [Xanthomonadaceae bacterium]|nr:DUF3667 domain-containing protein [Xanthomonadaceae bacterium]